jgi:hypothetical protein
MGPRGQPWWAQVCCEAGSGLPGRIKGFFTPWSHNQKTGGDRPRRFTRWRNEMPTISNFLPWILVIFDVKVKIVWKVIIRKRR